MPPALVAQPQRPPNRIHHVFSKAPLHITVEDLASVIADPGMQPFRAILQHYWQVSHPDNPDRPADQTAAVLQLLAAARSAMASDEPSLVEAAAIVVAAVAAATTAGPPPAPTNSSTGSDSCSSLPPSAAASSNNSSNSGTQPAPAAAPHAPDSPARMGAVQSPGGSSSSGASGDGPAAFQPYKAAVNTDTVMFRSCDQVTVPGDFNGRPVTFTIDPGAALSVFKKEWLQSNKHVVFFPGSSAELCELHHPSKVGGFIEGSNATVQYVVRNAALGIGDGVFPLNLQVVPGAAFDITLGLDFLWAYAARLVPRSLTDRSSGAQLLIPLPPQFRKPGVQVRPAPSWWNEQLKGPYVPHMRVRARYSVFTRPAAVTVVSPACLDGK